MLFQALAIAWATAHGAIIQDTATIRNPTLFSYTDELVRLRADEVTVPVTERRKK